MRLVLLLLILVPVLFPQEPLTKPEMIARAKALELPTPYVPPPGNALLHEAAGAAKVVCSAVFVSGFTPEFAMENLGFFIASPESRARIEKRVVDREKKTVSITIPDGPTRTAVYTGSQGCVTLAPGETAPRFQPLPVPTRLKPTALWPMGDSLPRLAATGPFSRAQLDAAMGAAFADPSAMTAAFLITWKGRIIAERYAPGIQPDTPLESWSMGKSVTATLLGILIQQGVYRLDQPAPIPEWSAADDPRRRIKIQDLLRMSSGLRIRAPNDPDFSPQPGYADHLYLYTGDNAFQYAATRPQQWPPNRVGRYRNTDPVLVNYLIRLAVEKRGESYHAFPRRALFDKIGMRSFVLETDATGNFLSQGYDLAPARDWARLGNLYLQNGLWNGQRIIPEDFVRFVRTPAPAWQADRNPVYGGFFWLNTLRTFELPEDAYAMQGAGGQYAIIVPSMDLVVVRMGHFRGSAKAQPTLNAALKILSDAYQRKGR